MRLAVIAPGYTPDLGGVESVVTSLTRALADLGVHVEVWAPLRGLGKESFVRDGAVGVRRFPATKSVHYSVSPALWRHVRRSACEFDLIHAHSYHSSAALGLLGPGERPPYVFSPHYHGVGHTAPAKLLHVPYGVAGRRLIAGAASVVAVSCSESDLLRADFRSPPVCPRVIHHGVDSASLRAAQPFPGQPPTALVVGRLEAYKHVQAVVNAFDLLDNRAQLVIIGDGPHRASVEAHVARARRRDDVVVRGAVGDLELRRWLRTARVVVNMSEQEAFGLVAVEGAAAGARVLLSNLPAHREVAELSEGAATIVARDARALAASLRRALDAPPNEPCDLRGWDTVAKEYLEVFNEVLSHRGSNHVNSH